MKHRPQLNRTQLLLATFNNKFVLLMSFFTLLFSNHTFAQCDGALSIGFPVNPVLTGSTNVMVDVVVCNLSTATVGTYVTLRINVPTALTVSNLSGYAYSTSPFGGCAGVTIFKLVYLPANNSQWHFPFYVNVPQSGIYDFCGVATGGGFTNSTSNTLFARGCTCPVGSPVIGSASNPSTTVTQLSTSGLPANQFSGCVTVNGVLSIDAAANNYQFLSGTEIIMNPDATIYTFSTKYYAKYGKYLCTCKL